MNEKKRIDYFDIAKGIAILAVILGHCWGISQRWIDFIFSFHMPVFFFISGYFLKQRDSRENAILKAKQLLVPYLITGLTIIAGSSVILIIKGSFMDEIYLNILNRLWAVFYGSGQEYQTPVYIPNAQALWFFPALFFALIVVNECIKKKNPAIWIGAIALLGYYTSKIFWLPLSLQAGMVSAVYVYMGYVVRKYSILDCLKKKIITVEIVVIYVLYYVWGGGRLYLVRNWFEYGIWEIIGSLCAVLCVIKISQVISEKVMPCKRIFAFLGRNTQVMLCFHIFDLSVFSWEMIYNEFSVYGNIVMISVLFICRVVWAVGGMVLFRCFSKMLRNKKKKECSLISQSSTKEMRERSAYIDITRGLAVLLMIYAHYPINPTVSTIIFSFHMPVFIIISGYFYNRNESMGKTVRKVGKNLVIPYILASGAYAVVSVWFYVFKTDISMISGKEALYIFIKKLSFVPWGMSFTSMKFQDIESVGPIWFIICLAFIRVLYSLMAKIFKDDKVLLGIVVIISIAGYFVGKYVAYLPWSADVGMVSLIFFHVGYLVRKGGFLDKPLNISVALMLFILWIVDIRFGGLDLAARKYSYVPLCIIGAVAGSILVLEFSKLLLNVETLKQFFGFCGRNSMIILCIYCLEQRTCSWESILPSMSANVVFIFRVMIILSFAIVCLSLKGYYNGYFKIISYKIKLRNQYKM